MNKVNCKVQDTSFENLLTGTIFFKDGGFFIKVDQEEILDMLEPSGDCDFEDFEVDRYTVPNAISLATGAAVTFSNQIKVDMAYPNATLSIN